MRFIQAVAIVLSIGWLAACSSTGDKKSGDAAVVEDRWVGCDGADQLGIGAGVSGFLAQLPQAGGQGVLTHVDHSTRYL